MKDVTSPLQKDLISNCSSVVLLFEVFTIIILNLGTAHPAAAQTNYSLGKNNSNAQPNSNSTVPQNMSEKSDGSLFENGGPSPFNSDDPASYKEPGPTIKSETNRNAKQSELITGKQNQLSPETSVPKVSDAIAPPTAPVAQEPVNQPPMTNTVPASGATGQNTEQSLPQATVPQATKIEPGSQKFPEAPLATDGSIAPVLKRDPLAPNEFSGVPPMPGTRKNLAQGETPEFYQVETGDTLFDVCSQLIDDGNYWPRLWSINPDIKNPHFIYPGMKLAFYPGDAKNPPFLDIVEEDDMVPVDKGELKESELIAQNKNIPELPKTNSNISATQESVEIIGPESVNVDAATLENFETGGASYTGEEINFTIPAFIFSTEQRALGIIEGGLRGELLSGDGIQVRIGDPEGLSMGSTLSVIRYRGEVENSNSGELTGYRYDFVGNIRVSQQLEEDSFSGVVIESYLGLRPGDLIVNYLSTKRAVSASVDTSMSSTIDGTIVSMGIYSQQFGGEGSLVFIDRGGLSAGESYHVFQKSGYRALGTKDKSTASRSLSQIGTVKIIDSSDKSTLAIILRSSAEIRIGDKLIAR